MKNHKIKLIVMLNSTTKKAGKGDEKAAAAEVNNLEENRKLIDKLSEPTPEPEPEPEPEPTQEPTPEPEQKKHEVEDDEFEVLESSGFYFLHIDEEGKSFKGEYVCTLEEESEGELENGIIWRNETGKFCVPAYHSIMKQLTPFIENGTVKDFIFKFTCVKMEVMTSGKAKGKNYRTFVGAKKPK